MDSVKKAMTVGFRNRIEKILRNCLVHFSGTIAILTLFDEQDEHFAVTTYQRSPNIDWNHINQLINDAQKARPQIFTPPDIPSSDRDLHEILALLNEDGLGLIVSSPLQVNNELVGVVNIFGEKMAENLVISDPMVVFEGYMDLAAEVIIDEKAYRAGAGAKPDADGIIRELPVGILMTDSAGNIIHINRAMADMLDIAPDVELGRDIRESTIFGSKRAYHYAKLLEESVHFEFINRYATPLGGEHFIKVKGYPYPRGGVTLDGMLVMAHDITEDIETRKKLTQQEKKHISQIKLAKDLQQDYFPPNFQKKRIKLATSLVSAKELAGDFFDTFDLGPNSLGVVIGDVVGKGIPASLMAMSVLGMISNAQGKMTSPMDVLAKVNAELVNRIKGDYWYATAFFAKIHVENLTMTFARAGHELPILWSESESKCHFLEGNGLPLGMFHNADYETCQVQMGEGDKLILYTDGLCDILNDEGERFGNQRLVDLIMRYSALSAKNLLKVIELNVAKFKGSHPQMDDMALIIISVVPDSWNLLSIPPYTYNEILENIIRELTLKNVSDDVIFKVRLSLDECITNAIKHGHRSNYLEKVHISYLIDSEKVVIQIKDRGEGFDYASLPDPTVVDNIALPQGRGVFLTMQVMDKVEFNDMGNQVTLTKYFANTEE